MSESLDVAGVPAKRRQLRYLAFRLVGWLAWLPLTGNPWHDRTYGDLKRLRPAEAVASLAPLACYALVAAWVYAYFPRNVVPFAASALAVGLFLGGTLVASSVVATKLVERTLVSR
jgi:hypothetical protein